MVRLIRCALLSDMKAMDWLRIHKRIGGAGMILLLLAPSFSRAESSCTLLFAAAVRAPSSALANLRQKVAKLRVSGRLERFDFEAYLDLRRSFETDSTRSLSLGTIEEETAFIEANYRRHFPSGEFSIEGILGGDDWVRKRRLYRLLEGARFGRKKSRTRVRDLFLELRALREGAEISVFDVVRKDRPARYERALRIEYENRLVAAGLARTLESFGLLRKPTVRERVVDALRNPHVQFGLNLLANVQVAIPVYHLYVGRLPELPHFKLSVTDEELLDLIVDGDPAGNGWERFLAKHGNRWTKQQVYAAASSIVMAGTLVALAIVHVDRERERFAAEDRDLKEKSDEAIETMQKRSAELAAEIAAERGSSLLDDVMESWAKEYRKEHGIDPDTTMAEYRAARQAYRELFAEE